MAQKELQPNKISMTSTKKEMLEAYNTLLKQLKEKRESELKPERKLQEKKTKEVIELADSLSSDGVVIGINNVKVEMGKLLAEISDKLEDEVNKFRTAFATPPIFFKGKDNSAEQPNQ